MVNQSPKPSNVRSAVSNFLILSLDHHTAEIDIFKIRA